jgi:hypothetical protein
MSGTGAFAGGVLAAWGSPELSVSKHHLRDRQRHVCDIL